MHYDGQVYRPPVEANTILLQVTSGCSHNKCKFCTMYYGTKFRVSPISEIEEDLREVSRYRPNDRKIYLIGADAFVLSFEKLREIILLTKKYLPNCNRFRMFARINNIMDKTPEQLKELKKLGVTYLDIGLESGDDETLKISNKGYTSAQALEQLKKLEDAGIDYFIAHLLGLAGHGNGERNALNSVKLYNQLKVDGIGATNLIMYPESEFYAEIQRGEYAEASELEKLLELKVLLENLKTETMFTSAHASNLFSVTGNTPKDNQRMLKSLQEAIDSYDEKTMRFLRSMRRSL